MASDEHSGNIRSNLGSDGKADRNDAFRLSPTDTICWYDHHAQEYAEQTRQVDLNGIRGRFLRHIPKYGEILDVGCGAGRDLRYFLEQGREAVGLDPSEKMAKLAAEYAGASVHQCRVQEFKPEKRFDGIWACASLVHVPRKELPDVFDQLSGWLRYRGALYTSFRMGEVQRSKRFFNDVNQEEAADLVRSVEDLVCREIWLTDDSRGRSGVKWINILADRQTQ